MLPRLILAATAVAALTAFVRDDAGTTATAGPQPVAPLVTPAVAQAAPRPAQDRPVRVVLPPLYASVDGTSPVAGATDAFIPTPGSPVGPRGAALTPTASGHRAVAPTRTPARAERAARHRQSTEGMAMLTRPESSGRQASRSVSLPGVVLR